MSDTIGEKLSAVSVPAPNNYSPGPGGFLVISIEVSKILDNEANWRRCLQSSMTTLHGITFCPLKESVHLMEDYSVE